MQKPFLLKNAPNTISFLNLLLGIVSITLATDYRLIPASYVIFICAGLDFLDGFAARILKVTSEFGKQFDSLADMVSFGIAPTIILYQLFQHSCEIHNISYTLLTKNIYPYIALLIAGFSAIRLAKFNLDKSQQFSFLGLPTPLNALVIASFPIILGHSVIYDNIILNFYFLIGYTVAMSFLLIMPVPMLSLKFTSTNFRANRIRYLFAIGAGILLLLFQIKGIFLILLLYIGLSIIKTI